MKIEQNNIKDKFKFSHLPTIDEIEKELGKESNLEAFYKHDFTIIDFGIVPFERKYFEIVLVWLYCGKLFNPQQKNSKIVFLEENFVN